MVRFSIYLAIVFSIGQSSAWRQTLDLLALSSLYLPFVATSTIGPSYFALKERKIEPGHDPIEHARRLRRSRHSKGTLHDNDGYQHGLAVPLLGGKIRKYSYMTNVTIDGNQTVEVLIDTGSVNLIVPGADCKSCFKKEPGTGVDIQKAIHTNLLSCMDERCQGICTAEMALIMGAGEHVCSANGGYCRITADYNNTDPVCVFRDNYGLNATAAGPLAIGPVTLASVTVPDAIYGLIEKASDNFGNTGVMGLGQGKGCTYDKTCFPSFFESMVAKGVANVFSICGNREEPVLIIGGTDPRLYVGELRYCDLEEPFDFYTVGVKELHIGNETIPEGANLQGYIDSGTTAIVMPDAPYQAFVNILQTKYCNIACMCRGDPNPICGNKTFFDYEQNGGLFHYDDDTITRFPTLVWTLTNGHKLNVSGRHYLMPQQQGPDGKWYYFFNVVSSGSAQLSDIPAYILGQPLLHKSYVEYDRAHQRIGFAKAVANCSAMMEEMGGAGTRMRRG